MYTRQDFLRGQEPPPENGEEQILDRNIFFSCISFSLFLPPPDGKAIILENSVFSTKAFKCGGASPKG